MKLKFEDLIVLSWLKEPKTVNEVAKEFGLTVEGARKKLKKYEKMGLVVSYSGGKPTFFVSVKSKVLDETLNFYKKFKKYVGIENEENKTL
jgi:predicted ArsR family transcriptional regulator